MASTAERVPAASEEPSRVGRFNRRRFLKRTASAAVGGSAVPYFVPREVLAAPGTPGANDRVGVGFIGTGNRGRMLMDQLPDEARIVAISDCFLKQCETALAEKGRDWPVYHDYRGLLDRKDIDAVVVPVTDHGRTLVCIRACQAEKDIYAEKPLTVSIGEGRTLVEAVRRHGRVFQVGSQQRSMEMNRFACELVRSGGIGRVHTVLVRNYTGPQRYTRLPKEPIPKGLDWDAWCGPTDLRAFNQRLYYGWMQWRSYSGGETTNWGAHGLDQVQWALGASLGGPLEIWPLGEGPNAKVSMRYPGGVLVRMELEGTGPQGGAIFVGDKAKIEINRNKFATNPPELASDPPPPEAAAVWEGPGWLARLHIQNWLDCIKTRQKPVADVEIGHRSISVCHLVNIARELGRKLRWDPEKETFPSDDEANALIDRPRRKGYELPEDV